MAGIQHSIRIASPPETVYPLTSTPKGFAEWWAADVTEAAGPLDHPTDTTGFPSTSHRGSIPKPAPRAALIRPFLLCGAPSAMLTVT